MKLTRIMHERFCNHPRPVRPENILNVFPQLHLSGFPRPAALHLTAPLSSRHESNVLQAPRK